MAAEHTSEAFSKIANREGKVTKLTEHLLEVTYKDGEVETYRIGETKGAIEGVVYTHFLQCDLKVGEKVTPGMPLFYHRDFFERDWLNPNDLVVKFNRIVTISIATNQATYEDSSIISHELMKEMITYNDKPIRKTLDFNTNIENLVNVGDMVEASTVLYVNTGEGENASNLDQDAITMIESVSALAPVAKAKGRVSAIEMKYNGELEDMSPTLRKLAIRLDKELYERTKGTEYEATSNKVTGEYMTDGGKLNHNQLELIVYIEVMLECGVGDKLVFGNQAKSVEGDVFNYSIVGVKSLDKVMGQFSFVGITHRMVASFQRQGTLNRVVRFRGKQIFDKYMENAKKK